VCHVLQRELAGLGCQSGRLTGQLLVLSTEFVLQRGQKSGLVIDFAVDGVELLCDSVEASAQASTEGVVRDEARGAEDAAVCQEDDH